MVSKMTQSAVPVLLGAMLMMATLPRCRAAEADQAVDPKTVSEQLGGGGFPILSVMPWGAIYAPENPAAADTFFADMKAAGFTATITPMEYLPSVQRTGLIAILEDPRLTALRGKDADRVKIRAVMAETCGLDAVGAYCLVDEPSANVINDFTAQIAEAKAVGKFPYICLLPNYATPGQLGSASYSNYLTRWIRDAGLQAVLFDHYAVFEDGFAGGSIRQEVFANFADAAAVSERQGVPLIPVVLAVRHYHYRHPDEVTLRFQANLALAYGAKGLGWYSYATATVSNYAAGPVDRYGRRTPTWEALRAVNEETSIVGTKMASFKRVRTYKVGPNFVAPEGSLITQSPSDLVVGEFMDAAGGNWLFLMNPSVKLTLGVEPTWRDSAPELHVFNLVSQQLNPFSGDWRFLSPGQGYLLKATKNRPAAH